MRARQIARQVFEAGKPRAYSCVVERARARARIKIENKAITAISISVDFGVTNYRVRADTGKKRGTLRSGKKCHQRRNTSLPQSHVHRRAASTRRQGPRLNQKINSILLFSHWRSKSCSATPPSNICHSPAAGSFRPMPSSLVNSSSSPVPKTRPNRSARKSARAIRPVLSAARAETRLLRRVRTIVEWPKCGERNRFLPTPVLLSRP